MAGPMLDGITACGLGVLFSAGVLAIVGPPQRNASLQAFAKMCPFVFFTSLMISTIGLHSALLNTKVALCIQASL